MAHRSIGPSTPSGPPTPSRPLVPPRTVADVLSSPWFYLFFAAAVGFVIAQVVTGQIAPRWVKALVGFFFLLALFRLPVYAVLALFLVAWPFPTFIYLGNSNVFFVLFILGVWGIKVRMGKEPVPPRSYLDWAAWAYILAHIISLMNVSDSSNLRMGIDQTVFLGFAVGVYFLASKVVRTESHMKTVFHALVVTSFLVSITGVMEYFFPDVVLIPAWYLDAGPTGKRLAEGGRVGGVFGFHGFLADFCAMMFILQLFLFVRSRNRWARLSYVILMAAAVFQIIVTANRGGFIIWALGVLYLLWIARSSLRVRQVVIALPFLAAVGAITEATNSRYLRAMALMRRLEGTQFEYGIVPDDRVIAWKSVLSEVPQHIWIGHGPYYNLLTAGGTLARFWPHSAYLWYLWTTGILGFSVFVWIMVKAIYKSRPGSKLKLAEIPFAHGAMIVTHIQILQFALSQVRDEHQRGNVNPFFMWALIGLSVSAVRLVKERKLKEREQTGLENEGVDPGGRAGPARQELRAEGT